MPKYMLIMRGTDETNAAMMAELDEMMVTTRRFIEELIKAGVYVEAEGLDDPGQGVVVEFSGEAPVVTDGPYGETKELSGATSCSMSRRNRRRSSGPSGFRRLPDPRSRSGGCSGKRRSRRTTRPSTRDRDRPDARATAGSDGYGRRRGRLTDPSARIVGSLTRLTGDFALAEDAAQEAVAQALVSWPLASPAIRRLLMATARRRAIDVRRRVAPYRRAPALLTGSVVKRPLPRSGGGVCAGGRYRDRTSDLFGVNADHECKQRLARTVVPDRRAAACHPVAIEVNCPDAFLLPRCPL